MGAKQVAPGSRIPCARLVQPPRAALPGSRLAERRHADVDREHRLGDPFAQQLAPIDDAAPATPAPHVAPHPEIHPAVDLPGHGQARGSGTRGIHAGCLRVEGELAVRFVGAVEPRHAVERLAVACQPHQDEVLDQVCDVLAGEPTPAGQVRHRCAGGVQIQLSAIVGDGTGREKLQEQVAGRLVWVHPLRAAAAAATAAERVSRQPRAVHVVARQQQAPHLRQRIPAHRVVPVPVHPLPQALVIQGDALPPERAEHHRRQPARADRQSLQPLPRRRPVPQLHDTPIIAHS